MHQCVSLGDSSHLYLSQRLLQRLDAIQEFPITYIHAPMGYGKTVAVREYLKSRDLRPIWTAVLTEDRGTFWQDLCRVLHKRLPHAADAIESMEKLGYPASPLQRDAVRGMVANIDFPDKTVFVFDDIHLLSGDEPGGLELCLLLAKQGVFPPLVLISRHAPEKIMAEPLLKGLAREIGPSVFTFSKEDILAYYRQTGIDITDEDAESLLKATGGWVAALYLYLLHYNRYGELAAPVEPHYLLESQIYDRVPEETRNLLLALSPLERFSSGLAEVFSRNAEAVLSDLLRRNAFITYDPVTGFYSFHALFRGYLQKEFRQLAREKQQDICLRSAEWLIGDNELRLAVKLLIEVNDFSRTLALLDTAVDKMPVTAGNGLLRSLFNSCPRELMTQYPGVTLRYAMAALSGKDFSTFGALLSTLERYCDSLPEEAAEANQWRGELELLRSFTKYNDIRAMSEHHLRATEFFRKAGATSSSLFGQDPWTLGSPSILYMFHRESGALEKTVKDMRTCLPHYSALTNMHGAGAEDVLLAEARYVAGEFQSAEVAAHRAIATAQDHGQVCNEVCALFVLARIAIFRSDYDAAMNAVATMRERVDKEKAFPLLQTVELCTGLLHVAIHRPESIPAGLLDGGEEQLYAFAGGSSLLVLGSSLLLNGKYAELAGKFSQLLEKGIFAHNVLFLIYARIFIAAANTGLGLLAKADAAMLAALELALPDNIYMPFVEHAAFLPQLKSLSDDDTYGCGVRRILHLVTAFEKARNGIISRHFPEKTNPLTPRERDLVRLVMTGMTYKKIASVTDLAPNSVKRYFAALYKKLGVNSRDQLIHLLQGKLEDL